MPTRLQLVAKINDPNLLDKSVHEDGIVLYQEDREGSIIRIVYFSTSRAVEYTGRVDEKLAAKVRVLGHRVKNILFDENFGSIEVIQENQPE